MQHRFEDAEAWAVQFESPERAAWQKPEEVVASLNLRATDVVADIGAGTGYFAVRLAAAVPSGRVIATDVEPDMVRYVRERAEAEGLKNLEVVKSTDNDAHLPAGVNVVFLCDVYHHIADRTAFFTGVASNLAEGGRVVIVDFKPDAPDDAPGPPRKHRISVEQLESELEPAGLVLASTDRDLLPYQYIASFRKRD